MYRIIVSLIIAGLTITNAQATVLRVPSQYPFIQAGIDASVNGDTVLVADGIYYGYGNRNLDIGGREIVVMSENGPMNCRIECERLGRGADFHSGETRNSVFKGFTIHNGFIVNGGGIRCDSAGPTIEYCIIYNNNYGMHGPGGGIYVANGDPAIISCAIYANAGTQGGGVYAENSNLTVNSCIVAANDP